MIDLPLWFFVLLCCLSVIGFIVLGILIYGLVRAFLSSEEYSGRNEDEDNKE